MVKFLPILKKMDAIKRASFASKRLPAGPAPLASFEDLQSDELESPEDNNQSSDDDIAKQQNVIEIDQSPIITSCIDTPDSVTTISSQSTPHIESDFDSQFTLTPSDSSRTTPLTNFHTESFSSLSRDETSSSVKQKKIPATSLSKYNIPNNDSPIKTNSFTDVFHNHAEVDAYDKNFESIKRKSLQKKSKSEIDVDVKDKGKFLSMLKGKKNGKSSDYLTSPDNNLVMSRNPDFLQNANINNSLIIANGKENELPNKIDLHPMLEQNDLDKSTIHTENYKTDEECEVRNALNIAEKEYNIVANEAEKELKMPFNEKNVQMTKVDEEMESSESDITLESKSKSLKEKGNGIEAEILLPQDSSEMDDDSLIELTPMVFKIPKPISIMSRQQRQDVTTIPIERPRSTTPINVAPLEAFIRSASPSFDSKAEKIKLSLPGEQFLGRLKSPKRGTSKSWTDFCVEVLHSPRMPKREDFPENIDMFNLSTMEKKTSPCWDSFEISEKQWVTFESNTEKENLPDLFRDIAIAEEKQLVDDNLSSQDFDKQFSKCTCTCHYEGCDNVYICCNKANEGFNSDVSSKYDLFSDKCQCQCHEKYLHLWNPSSFINNIDFTTTTTCSSQLSNIDDAIAEEKI